MFWLVYNALLILCFPVIISLLMTKKRCRRGLLARLGKVPTGLQAPSEQLVWVHAASLGEVTAIVPLLKAMKEEDPYQEIVVSTVTETGREMVLKQLKGIATHFYAPVDLWWAVSRYVRVLNPQLFLLVESEIWPNLLTSLQQHQVPVCLVNGRISSRSFPRYRLVRKFMKKIWSSFDLALMQTNQDAERIRELGAKASVVHVTGNMKFDQALELPEKNDSIKAMRKTLGVKETELVIVAGSTHPQEEEYILEAFKSLIKAQKHLVLVLAPRHIERASELEKVIVRYGLPFVRRSQINQKNPIWNQEESPRVILLDSRGELPFVYRVGFVGFVGGTFVPVGGHNLLEPARWSRPVLFGPYVDHCRDIAHQLLQAGGAIQIHQSQQLAVQLFRLLENPQEVEKMGRQALAVIQENRGVVEKNLRMIHQLNLHSGPTSSGFGKLSFDSSRENPNIMRTDLEPSSMIVS